MGDVKSDLLENCRRERDAAISRAEKAERERDALRNLLKKVERDTIAGVCDYLRDIQHVSTAEMIERKYAALSARQGGGE